MTMTSMETESNVWKTKTLELSEPNPGRQFLPHQFHLCNYQVCKWNEINLMNFQFHRSFLPIETRRTSHALWCREYSNFFQRVSNLANVHLLTRRSPITQSTTLQAKLSSLGCASVVDFVVCVEETARWPSITIWTSIKQYDVNDQNDWTLGCPRLLPLNCPPLICDSAHPPVQLEKNSRDVDLSRHCTIKAWRWNLVVTSFWMAVERLVHI